MFSNMLYVIMLAEITAMGRKKSRLQNVTTAGLKAHVTAAATFIMRSMTAISIHPIYEELSNSSFVERMLSKDSYISR